MMKFNCSCVNLFITIILLVPYSVYASWSGTKIPTKGYCVDDHCSKPISTGEVSIKYFSNDACVLRSKANREVTIYSRSDDKKLYPLVEIDGKRGFFPPNLFREKRVIVRKEEVNIPVEFECSNGQVTITKAEANESSSSLSKASDVISSNDSNTTSFQETPAVPPTPLSDEGSKGFLFAHASAAEASASPHNDYAPGHPPPIEPPDVVTSAPTSSGDPPSSDGSPPVSENIDVKAQSNKNDVLKEADTTSKIEAGSKDESSAEKIDDTSAGMKEEDDEEDDDDVDIDVDSEIIPPSAPIVPSLQTTLNEKTETVGTITSTPPVHPSTSLEGSVEIETPLSTPVVPSTGLPYAPFSHAHIQASKPEIAGISPSDTLHLAHSDQKQDEIATTEPPKTSEAITVNQSIPQNVSTPTSSNLSDSNAQTEASSAESSFTTLSKDVSSLSSPSDRTGTVSNPTNESLPAEESTPETPVNVNFTDGSPNATASPTGDKTPSKVDLPSSEEAAPQNETISTQGEAKPTDSDRIQQPLPLSADTPVAANETSFSESNDFQEVAVESQQEAMPPQNMDFYRPPIGHGQHAPSPPSVLSQLSAGHPLQQPPPTGQPPPEPPVADLIQPMITPSPQVQESSSLPPPSSDTLPPTTPPALTQESPPTSQGYPPPLDVPVSPPLATPSPVPEEQSSPPPVSEEPLLPPPVAQSVDPSNLYETPSPTPFSESGAPGQPATVEPVNIAPPENYETSTAPSTVPEEIKAPEQDSQEEPETSTSFLSSFLSLFSSSESSVDPFEADVATPEAPVQISSFSEYAPQQDALQKDGVEVTTCSDGSVGPDCPQQSFLPFQIDDLFSNIGVDSLMTRFIAAAVTLLLCIIAYFFFENRRMDSSLVARVNTLERQLMVLSKENTLLKEECSSNIGQGQLELFLEELRETKAAKAELEEQVATLERDLDEAAEANMELNQMLEQTLENPKGSTDDVLASVERLQAQLDGQRDTIGNMTRSISSKNAEIESLKIQLIECRETISGLEAEVTTLNETVANVRREKEDANIAHVEKLQQMQNQLAEALANKVLEESRLGSELSSVKLNLKKTRQIVVAKESEVEALKESFKELKSKGASEETVGKLFDAVKLHSQVEQLTQERNELEDNFHGEADARKRLEDHVRVIEEEVSKLRVSYEEAQKEKAEAQTRLEVLSNYFKEKEAQLKKEVDLQEILLAQQRGDENSVLRRVKSLQEEVENYRSQNESLKREILDQERDFKGQMATLEKKSHDNWVSARQAERKLEESRQEASLLRNRLTLVEKNLSSPGEAGGVEANGEGGIISPVMGLPGMGPMGALMGPMGPLIPPPPPPIDLDSSSGLPFMFPPLSPGSIPPPHFIPPLPPPLMAGDRRPPPLGRMSSPPPAPPPPPGHFSPPPPHFDRLDRPSQSPSPTYHRSPAGGAGERQGFRPFAKPNPRKPTDYRGSNLSSGQSNEPMEKTRRNERV